MNGAYTVSSGGGTTNVPFNSDYASKGHEYFDVWSPEIATQYAEVFWHDMGPQPLPPAIVARFANKTMAITGYEMDMVMVEPSGAAGRHPERDVSVPISWAYNHHYEAWMTGAYSVFGPNEHPDPLDVSHHGGPAKYVATDTPGARSALGDVPSSLYFSEGNGGESRKSFHGYPNGFAQLIGSPDSWHITPMQIDTRNRECGVTPADIKNCTKFEAWLEPKSARYGRSHLKEGSPYSGVLECPCTDRWGGSPIFYPDARTKVNGSNCEHGGRRCDNFTKPCVGPWDGDAAHGGGDLLAQRNPTCWSATYAGGLRCCRDRHLLLDREQDPGPTLLRYHMKFRFWFEEYRPATASAPKASHFHLPRYYYLTERDAGEYDVPPAFRAPGDPDIPGYDGWPVSTEGDMHLTPGSSCSGGCPHGADCTCVHTITSRFTIAEGSMIYAGGHCHAPACISIELYKNDTGVPELLCRQVSVYGKGDVAVDKFDEEGYVALPPCLWGAKEEGLQPPVFLPAGTPMYSVTRTENSRVGHTGQMASWQMRGVPFELKL